MTSSREMCSQRLRLAFPPGLELVLSTREAPELRNRPALQICITQMSAGSSTVPGGYLEEDSAAGLGQQFPVHDLARRRRSLPFSAVWGSCPSGRSD